MELINKEDAVALIKAEMDKIRTHSLVDGTARINLRLAKNIIEDMPTIDIVRCKNCRKSHIDGKTTHYLWCTEWGRSTDTFGYCERGEREGE